MKLTQLIEKLEKIKLLNNDADVYLADFTDVEVKFDEYSGNVFITDEGYGE